MHNKYCKAILGIKKSACNIAAKSELGRFPFDSFIKTQILMYFCRLNTDAINPLLKEAYHHDNVNTKLNNEGIPQALVARTTPLFLTFCLQIYFQ